METGHSYPDLITVEVVIMEAGIRLGRGRGLRPVLKNSLSLHQPQSRRLPVKPPTPRPPALLNPRRPRQWNQLQPPNHALLQLPRRQSLLLPVDLDQEMQMQMNSWLLTTTSALTTAPTL